MAGVEDDFLSERMNAASIQHGSDTAEQRTERSKLLTLPRELRDYIYQLAFCSDLVKTPPYACREGSERGEVSEKNERFKGTAHCYKYPTALLRTNHQIYTEAIAFLYHKVNTFVVVSFKWPGLELTKHLLNVPIVTENVKHVVRFKNHSLRIHVINPKVDCPDEVVQSFLILAEDLPQLCNALQWLYFTMSSPAPIAVKIQGHPELPWQLFSDPGGHRHFMVKTLLQLRAPFGKEMTPAHKARLLAPLEKLIIGKQKVTVKSSAGNVLTGYQSFQSIMGPEVVWMAPMAWRMLELVRNLKGDADALMRVRLFGQAAEKYTIILTNLNFRMFHLPQASYDWESALPIGLVLRTMLDAATTVGFIGIRLGKLDICEPMVNALQSIWRFMRTLPDPHHVLIAEGPEDLDICFRQIWMTCVVEFLLKDRDPVTIDHLASKMLRMTRAISDRPRHFDHDAKLIMQASPEYGQRNSLSSKAYLSGLVSQLELNVQTSVVQIGLFVINTPPPKDLKMVAGIDAYKGFQRPEYLAELRDTNSTLAAQTVRQRPGDPISPFGLKTQESSDVKVEMQRYGKPRAA